MSTTEGERTMKRLFRIAAIVSALAASCAFPRGVMAQATDPFLGQTMTSAHDFCPTGWAPMNGQLMSISQNTALFSLLGTRYGGDGKTTFALPTAKPIFTASGAPLTQCIAVQGVFPPRP
jgi:microcystin-dependent protein